MTSADKSRLAKKLARAVGFDLAGVARAEPSARGAYYRDWLARGHAGSMSYLARNVESRCDPRGLLAGARSIIAVAVLYKRADGYEPTPPVFDRPVGRIAQYARGADYHDVVRRMLEDLAHRLRAEITDAFDTRACVDTAPLLERDVARAAGIGWIGKNTCVLHPELGSYLLLGELITTLDLEPDEPLEERCRSCTRCLDACPTGALIAPHRMDASRCIAYLTIEHRGTLPSELQTRTRNWVFGCDVCQQVCPYNAKAPLGRQPEIMAERAPANPDLSALLKLSNADYRTMTSVSALRRAKLEMLHRNAIAAMENLARLEPAPDEAHPTSKPKSANTAGPNVEPSMPA